MLEGVRVRIQGQNWDVKRIFLCVILFNLLHLSLAKDSLSFDRIKQGVKLLSIFNRDS